VSDNPLGPFKVTGVIMKETAGCWTNHHSIIQFRNQWYLFYHANDYSPGFDKARSVRIDSLFFRPDGTIEQVIPTWRGVGITRASDEIQIDRYSARSQEGITISFNDTTNRFMGWKIIFDQPGAWVQYNNVDAGANKSKSILAKVKSTTGGKLQVRSGGPEGLVLAELDITPSDNWQYIKSELRGMKKGIFHLVVTLKGNQPVELDWIRFE
jgi:Carbohydrate binding module (family 6)